MLICSLSVCLSVSHRLLCWTYLHYPVCLCFCLSFACLMLRRYVSCWDARSGRIQTVKDWLLSFALRYLLNVFIIVDLFVRNFPLVECNWKNFRNWSVFGEDMNKSLMSCFFWLTVYTWLLCLHCLAIYSHWCRRPVADILLQGVHSIACYASPVLAIARMSVCLSVRPSIRHTLALSDNDAS